MTRIVLTTINAKYIHTAFGLRYLKANLGALQPNATILEFTIQQRPVDMLEAILAEEPDIVGVGVYIWNAEASLQLVAALKAVRPEIVVVLGGPEISHEVEAQPIAKLADHIICGEADVAFRELCLALKSGEARPHLIRARLPTMDELTLPYNLYSDDDVKQRVVYVEASRGCPFRCEFCLSSLQIPVRTPDLDHFLAQMDSLLDRGLNHFKFVDRTFNLNLKFSAAILNFFKARYHPDLFLHFEMIPDRLPAQLREIIASFPTGALQFEVGIQTFNPSVAKLISRRQNYDRLRDNLTFLRAETGVHIHADLIAGLPSEDLNSFAEGFDSLVKLRPQEIQVGILKRLRGTPIVRHDKVWGMRYNPSPPYELLESQSVSFEEMQSVRRFSQTWDRVANSGNFVDALPLIWRDEPSQFHAFMDWTKWLYSQEGRTHGISLKRLVVYLFRFLTETKSLKEDEVALALIKGYQRGGRNDVPAPLKPFLDQDMLKVMQADSRKRSGNKRQRLHA